MDVMAVAAAMVVSVVEVVAMVVARVQNTCTYMEGREGKGSCQ